MRTRWGTRLSNDPHFPAALIPNAPARQGVFSTAPRGYELPMTTPLIRSALRIATVAALPLLVRLRRLGGAPDEIVGQHAGVEGACAASGLPAVSSVDTSVHEVAELTGVASRA